MNASTLWRRWRNFLGHGFRFREGVLASPSRRRDLWKGAAFESPSEQLERPIPPSATKGI
jgi:hypothetical protein